ncbi:site-2 protease family protein [Patescibacteria group bacterium]|nr:site-2 protease family protein [Patescibacteria group bacterium]
MLVTILAGLLMIIILVAIHELGHLLVARHYGVGVEEFSIGFGPGFVLWQTKNFPIYFRYIPLGGYVTLKSRTVSQNVSQGKHIEDVSWLQNIFIMIGGISFNLILAVLIRTVMYLFAPPEVLVQFGPLEVNFVQGVVWYLAPFYAIERIFIVFFSVWIGVLMTFWRLIIPILTLTPIPHGGIAGMINLGANIHLGFWSYTGLICFVSTLLASLNILPFMPLDGGHVAKTLAERLFGQGIVFKLIRLLINVLGAIFLGIMFLNLFLSDLYDLAITAGLNFTNLLFIAFFIAAGFFFTYAVRRARRIEKNKK